MKQNLLKNVKMTWKVSELISSCPLPVLHFHHQQSPPRTLWPAWSFYLNWLYHANDEKALQEEVRELLITDEARRMLHPQNKCRGINF